MTREKLNVIVQSKLKSLRQLLTYDIIIDYDGIKGLIITQAKLDWWIDTIPKYDPNNLKIIMEQCNIINKIVTNPNYILHATQCEAEYDTYYPDVN